MTPGPHSKQQQQPRHRRLFPHRIAPREAPSFPLESLRSEFISPTTTALSPLSLVLGTLTPSVRAVRVPASPPPQRAVAQESGPRGLAQSAAAECCPPFVVAAVAVAVARHASSNGLILPLTSLPDTHSGRDKHLARGPVRSSPCVGVGHTRGLCGPERATEEETTRQSTLTETPTEGEDSDDESRVLEKVAKTADEPGRCSSTSRVHGRSR